MDLSLLLPIDMKTFLRYRFLYIRGIMEPKNFRAPTPKQVLSKISRELGPDATIVSHKEIQDSKGRLWVEATSSPNVEGVVPDSTPLISEKITAKLSSKKLLVPALVFIALIIVGAITWQLFLRKTADDPLSQRLSVAVVSFENHTGDNSYDYLNKVIPNLLITNLEQSGYFYVTSWERLNDLLKQKGEEDPEVIDNDLGFELCQMDEVDAIVIGSFAKAGDMFVTDIKVLDVETKRILKSASSRGEGEESIIQSQIDELSEEISRGIGVPAYKIERNPVRIADVATNSMDAYYYYLRGKEELDKFYHVEARKFLEKAVEFDPNFAMAYLHLSSAYGALGERQASDEAFKKAKTLSEKATEKERLYIEIAYASRIEKNQEKEFRILKRMEKKYPKEKKVHHYLGNIYSNKKLLNEALENYKKALELDPNDGFVMNLIADVYLEWGDYEKGIEYLENYAAISPGDANPLDSMAWVYLGMGKLDEAIAKWKEALEAKPDFFTGWGISYPYALKEDYTEAMRWIDRYIINVVPPDLKGWGYFIKSFYLYWLGSLDKSMSNLLRQIDFPGPISLKQWNANMYWMMGWISFDRSEFKLSRKHFKSWFDIYMQDLLPRRRNPEAIKKHWTAWYYFYLGLVDVKQGRIESARSRLVEINSLLPDVLPEYKDWIKFYYDFLRAEVSLTEGAVEKAIAICEKSSPLGGPVKGRGWALHNVPFLKDVLARAYQQNGEIDKAIAEYERLVVFDPQREERCLIHPKNYYRLARLYEQKGLKKKAIEHYQRFLNLWQDGDPDIPEVIEAKKRLSKLQSFL